VNSLSVTKAHLGLGRMDVDIDVFRGHVDQQDGSGIPPRFGQAPIGFAQRMLNELVADGAVVEVVPADR
jgi:hypothetical protein